MSHPFFAYISRMRYITRWGLMRNTMPENIQEHSHMVAVFAHALAVIGRDMFEKDVDPGSVAAAALYHDASEIFTGDLPTPVKYQNPEIREAYKDIEARAAGQLLSMLPVGIQGSYEGLFSVENPEYVLIIRAADKLSAYVKCLEELKAGNMEFKSAAEQTYDILRGFRLPELHYFMEQFLPSFSQTLDELQSQRMDY